MPDVTAWREEAVLILRRGATLPDNCLRCGASAQGYRRRTRLHWHHPAIYLLVVSPCLYVLVALLARRSFTMEIPVCRRHRLRRALGLGLGWIGAFVGTLAMSAGLSLDSVALALVGLYVFLAALVAAAILVHLYKVVRVSADTVRLRGADLTLLDALPQGSAAPPGAP